MIGKLTKRSEKVNKNRQGVPLGVVHVAVQEAHKLRLLERVGGLEKRHYRGDRKVLADKYNRIVPQAVNVQRRRYLKSS